MLSTIVTKLEADGTPMWLVAWSFTFSIVECNAEHFAGHCTVKLSSQLKGFFQGLWFVLYHTVIVVSKGMGRFLSFDMLIFEFPA